MTRQLDKLFDMLWYTSIGLFLGLHAGTILAVVETFDSSRKIDATPGLAPYSEAQFEPGHNELVAGFIAQNMFKNGGVVLLVLLGVALLSRILGGFVQMTRIDIATGSKKLSTLRWAALLFCVLCMAKGTSLMMEMNSLWPTLYDTTATEATLTLRRDAFDAMHKTSERVVGAAWFAGAIALVISPWCRRLSDSPLQSRDGEKDNT